MRARVPRSVVVLLAVAGAVGCGNAASTPSTTFRVAFLSDTHLIDQYYVGPENTPLDTESIYQSAKRLQEAQSVVNHIYPRVEQVFVSGDIVHDFASTDPAFYETNQTVFDIAHELFSGFTAPVYLGFGNHDYEQTVMPRTTSEQIFKEKLGVPSPYYAVDYKGWRFLMMNCFQGDTYDPDAGASYDPGVGSFGQAQLEWMAQELSADMPTVITFHIPLPETEHNELPGVDFFETLASHPSNVKMIITGHTHIWFDLGTYSGVDNMDIAATRYDENSFAIADLTTDTHEFNFVHQELWHMAGHGADPWPASELR